MQGVVADVLTKGDHPRGVKVRLVDGRVGRVQRLAGTETAPSQRLHTHVESHIPVSTLLDWNQKVMQDQHEEAKEHSGVANLGDYVVAKKQKLPRKANTYGATEEVNTAICPICEDFEGDETAVAYHVEEHFT